MGAGIDEASVVTVLYPLAQRCLHRLLRVVGNDLKLVYGNDVRTVGAVEEEEDLVECDVRMLDVTDGDAPCRQTLAVECYGVAQRCQHADECLPGTSAVRFQLCEDSLAEFEDQLVEVLRLVDVDEEGVVPLLYPLLCEHVVYQSRFAETSFCNECDVPSVGDVLHQQSCLILSVAEVFWCDVTFYYEWIVLIHSLLQYYDFYVTLIS